MTLSASSGPIEGPLRITRHDAVVQVRLNRPESRNPLGPEMIEALAGALDAAEHDPGVRVLLITAAGEAFSAGGNLGNLGERLGAPAGADGRDPIAVGNRRYGDFLARLRRSPKISIAAVQGAAMGGGAGLVCAADLSIGLATARFGFPEATIGLVPGQILPFVAARIGAQAARRLMLTGERIDGAEAHRIGMLDHLVDDVAGFQARTEALLASVLACAPSAGAATKRMLLQVQDGPEEDDRALSAYLDRASEAFARQMRTEAIEGVEAARARRKPSWATSAAGVMREPR